MPMNSFSISQFLGNLRFKQHHKGSLDYIEQEILLTDELGRMINIHYSVGGGHIYSNDFLYINSSVEEGWTRKVVYCLCYKSAGNVGTHDRV